MAVEVPVEGALMNPVNSRAIIFFDSWATKFIGGVIVFVMGGMSTVWVPLYLEQKQAARELLILQQERIDETYSAFMDSAQAYRSQLSRVGVLTEEVTPIANYSYEHLSDQNKLTEVQGAYLEFQRSYEVAARDVTPESMHAYNALRRSLPPLSEILAAGETIDAQVFRDALFAFTGRYRVEGRGSDPIWG